MPKAKVILLTATGNQLAEVIAAAVKLGVRDATDGVPPKTGKDVRRLLCHGSYRHFHETALKDAYRAGRYHVEAMGAA